MNPELMRLLHPKITPAALMRMHVTNVLTWWSVWADAVTEAYWLELKKRM